MVRTTIPWAVLLVDGVRAGNGALGPGHRPGLFIVSLVNVYAARAGRRGRPWTYAGRAERLLRGGQHRHSQRRRTFFLAAAA